MKLSICLRLEDNYSHYILICCLPKLSPSSCLILVQHHPAKVLLLQHGSFSSPLSVLNVLVLQDPLSCQFLFQNCLSRLNKDLFGVLVLSL